MQRRIGKKKSKKEKKNSKKDKRKKSELSMVNTIFKKVGKF